MPKIPVGATIAQAYRFAFGDLLKILSIIWLPWLVLSAANLLLRTPAMTLSQDIATNNFAGVGPLLLIMVPLYLFGLYALFMQITGITQQALGLRTGSPFYYLSFGRPVWRLIGAFLLTALIILGLYLGFILAGIVLGLAFAFVGKMAAAAAVIATFAVGFGAYIYIIVRLAFLLNPVVIAESRIGIGRSWSLGKGNFWRMFLIILATLVPIVVVLMFIFLFWYGGFPPPRPINATPDQIAAANAATATWIAAAMKRSTDYWYIVIPGYG